MNARKTSLVVGLLALATLAGCASSLSGDTYSRDEALRTMTYLDGTITAVRKVRLEGTKSYVGTGAGAVIGGIAGSGLGEGKGSQVAAVAGAVLGGLAGSAAEEGITRQDAWEITLKMDNGENRIVVQEAGNDNFVLGQHVRLVQGNGKTRVVPADASVLPKK